MNLHHDLFLMQFGLDRVPVQPANSVAAMVHSGGPESARFMTVVHEGRAFVLEARGPLGEKWNPVARDADAKAGWDLIARLLANADAVRRMGRGEEVQVRTGDGPLLEFRFSLPAGGFSPT